MFVFSTKFLKPKALNSSISEDAYKAVIEERQDR